MRHPRLSFALGVLALTAGCSTSDYSVGPKLPRQPRLDTVLDCTLNPAQCEQIQRGINVLKNHANAICRLAGHNAQGRYDAASGEGFRNEPQDQNYEMGVNPSPYPSDGYTMVYPKFWSNGWDDVATGALIAHEEVHHLGGDENSAKSLQDSCLNPQS